MKSPSDLRNNDLLGGSRRRLTNWLLIAFMHPACAAIRSITNYIVVLHHAVCQLGGKREGPSAAIRRGAYEHRKGRLSTNIPISVCFASFDIAGPSIQPDSQPGNFDQLELAGAFDEGEAV